MRISERIRARISLASMLLGLLLLVVMIASCSFMTCIYLLDQSGWFKQENALPLYQASDSSFLIAVMNIITVLFVIFYGFVISMVFKTKK